MSQWQQDVIVIDTRGRGFHELTAQVEALLQRSGLRIGLCHLFLRHTSASLCITENADPDELYAAQEEHRENRGGVSGEVIAGKNFDKDFGDRYNERDDAYAKAEIGSEAQRYFRERGDAVKGEAQHFGNRIFR